MRENCNPITGCGHPNLMFRPFGFPDFTSGESKQLTWDVITEIPTADHILSTWRTSGGDGGMFADTTLLTEALNNVPVLGVKAFGANPGSIVTMPHLSPTAFPVSSSLLWFKNETGASSAIAAIFDGGDMDKSLRIHNGAIGLNAWETNPGSLSPAKTNPLDCIFMFRNIPGVSDESLLPFGWYDWSGVHRVFGMITTEDCTQDYYKTIIIRTKIDASGNASVWIKREGDDIVTYPIGKLVYTTTGQSFTSNDITLGTSSHTPFVYFYTSVTSFGVSGFTDEQVATIMNGLSYIVPLGKPTYPVLTNITRGSADAWTGTGWNPSFGLTPVFTGGNGIAGTHKYIWYYWNNFDSTLFPSADGILSNHRQVPSSIDMTTMAVGNSISVISIDGVNLLSSLIPWAVSTAATVTAVAANINLNQSNFLAYVVDSTCIQFHPKNNSYRPDTLAFTASGFTPTIVQTAKGATIVKATYSVKGQIWFGHTADSTVKNMRVTFPIDSEGTIGEPVISHDMVNNF